jgi:AraC-like DNA-binding protein
MNTLSFYLAALADYAVDKGLAEASDRAYLVNSLLSVFGEKGTILTISEKEKDVLRSIIESVDREKSLVRKRFLVFYLLSYIDDISKKQNIQTKTIPPTIHDVMIYITRHYAEKIVAKELADMMHIGRTTLMTQFKKYTGKTLHEYVTSCRMKNAVKLLSEGKTEYDAAISCGFSDSSSFIQCFKRVFNTTPRQYIKLAKNENFPNVPIE